MYPKWRWDFPYKAVLGVGFPSSILGTLNFGRSFGHILDVHPPKVSGAAPSPRGFARAPGPEAGALADAQTCMGSLALRILVVTSESCNVLGD